MIANDFHLISYSAGTDSVSLVIDAPFSDLVDADMSLVGIKTDEGSPLETFAGYTKTSVSYDIRTGYVTVTLVMLDTPTVSMLTRLGNEYQAAQESMADVKTEVTQLAGSSAAQTRSTLQLLAAKAATTMTQTELHNVGSVWPDFTPGAFYRTRQLVRFEGHYYFVLTDTWATTGDDNRPDKDTKAYKLMGTPNADGVFPFNAPLGEADAYGIGDRVLVQDTVYVSQTDKNVSVPGQGEDGNKYWAKA